ncbi:hypothetical protein TrispH2_010272 [Trichoplax sp. H2]|nr:hypothetical protein TrispH2_010272 [Trichoplax sp. H2]|eukprot:RDD37327.1 hypothetical protein TrispH2_010272 [Trichoplax sp. H2]
MAKHNPMEHVLELYKQFRDSDSPFIVDEKNNIRYSVMQEEDMDEAMKVIAISFIEQNEIYKSRGVTVEQYILAAKFECRLAMEDKLAIVARDIENNKLVGVGIGYVYSKVTEVTAGENVINNYGEAMAPIMDCMMQLYEDAEKKESFDPKKMIVIDDVACLRGEKYASKAIGFLSGFLVEAISARHGYDNMITTIFNPIMQKRALAVGYRLICSVDLNEYTYKDEKVFLDLVAKGYKEVQIFIKDIMKNNKK